MTPLSVAELIEELKKADPDASVYIRFFDRLDGWQVSKKVNVKKEPEFGNIIIEER